MKKTSHGQGLTYKAFEKQECIFTANAKVAKFQGEGNY
tara:strand:- start:89 stop:202 length:114 start_codon:yes stop_codon:yes gene_type:complete